MKELFKVLKDHKNPMMQEHCYRNEMESVLGEGDLMDSQDCETEKVTRMRLTNSTFSSMLQLSITMLFKRTTEKVQTKKQDCRII